MGNCQAIDNATLVIQHPCGRVDKLYWPVTAGEVMKTNPGHYVALLLTTTTTTFSDATNHQPNSNNPNSVRITRIKLLRPTDTLTLGHVYRLITAQEVMRGLWAKKYAKMKKKQSESDKREVVKERPGCDSQIQYRRSEMVQSKQVPKQERNRTRVTASSGNCPASKSRAWQPSLKSISEATS
ncbi:uncharacterized protein LOC127796044 [Diospyros lotus]|uniref:uncharacterized protein LOC127796044 n=1 Tax=Diospyros lotus TaxID=55363 RepID=UPI00224E98A4|nr:uncharacterized protein LOC127796044 [Diospyros lotus]